MYKIRKIQNYLSKDVKKLSKLRVVKNLKMIGKMIGKMIVDHDLIEITFFAQSDRDLIGDHIFPSDR